MFNPTCRLRIKTPTTMIATSNKLPVVETAISMIDEPGSEEFGEFGGKEVASGDCALPESITVSIRVITEPTPDMNVVVETPIEAEPIALSRVVEDVAFCVEFL
ncbi:hypothetical protein HDU76_001916 [Blyttiomyces sp. JEL0837]|nr:hypothetical protein HDU76_001916 [Blyttiomyces sp. JEL0837]